MLCSLFSCRKENINGIYIEINDTTHAVTYYDVSLNETRLAFSQIKPKKDERNIVSGVKFVHAYEKTFSYSVYGDSLYFYKQSIIYPANLPDYPQFYYYFFLEYNMGRFSIVKDKIILKLRKFSESYLLCPYPCVGFIKYSDTAYYTRIFHKVKGMNKHLSVY